MHYLVPYVRQDPQDPVFDEFTYGENGRRANRLREKVGKGDYLFFHTTIHRQKVVTAYFVVDRIMRTSDVMQNRHLKDKYHNPHLANDHPEDDDVIVFGDPIESRELRRPLPFDRNLANGLGLKIKFGGKRSDTETIGSACREWRDLQQDRADYLLSVIEKWEKSAIGEDTIFSTDEITQILERDIENYLVRKPRTIGMGLKIAGRQKVTPVGRLDLLLEDQNGNLLVVELKLDLIGRDAVRQLRRYMDFVKGRTRKEVRGAIVCRGVLPAFEEELSNLQDIEVFTYGWRMGIQKW